MNVLVVTGDKTFGPGHPRYELQRSVVDRLGVIYFGPDSLWPKHPKGRFDVITAQDPFWRGHLAWHLTWWYQGARLNIQVHTDLSVYSPFMRWFAGFNLRKADTVRVVSEKIKEQVRALGVTKPIHVLPIFVDVPAFSSVIRRSHVGKNILWVGRFEDEKNPIEAIRVLKEVRTKIPDARLTMIGEGSLRQQLSDAAADLPVTVSQSWKNPLVYLDTADVVLSTSKHESWGASIVEALAAGIPVVAPDVGIARKAGAAVVPRGELAPAVVAVLKTGAQGTLHIQLPTKSEWAHTWKETL